MKITYIIFITCFASHCLGEENEGKKITSSYSYSIEYNDSDNGNFGHKVEVKDGTAKVNVRSENTNKLNSAVATKPGTPYLPQKPPVVFAKPKEEVAYVSAPKSSTVAPIHQNLQNYAEPELQAQAQKNAAIETALKKYSQQQLSILLSQNKNPFLPLDPKDSINKFISKYITPQQSHPPSAPQTQPSTAYVPQTQPSAAYVPQSNNYLNQYPAHSYPQNPAFSSAPNTQHPTTYYTPSVPQQQSQGQQHYYPPPVQHSYSQPATHIPSVPQTHSVPATQGPVQYVYVPQTASHPSPASYVAPQTGPVQFAQQNYQTPKQQYVPSTSAYQHAQLPYNIPKAASYPTYNHASQQGQQNIYTSSVGSGYASPQTGIQGKQQYVTVPSNTVYQTNQVSYNTAPKVASPVNQPSYQNIYGSPLAGQYPSSSFGSPPNIEAYKPAAQSHIAVPSSSTYQTNQASPVSQPSYQNVFGNNLAGQYPSSSHGSSPNIEAYKPATQGQLSQGNFDFSKFTQYVPPTNQATPTVTYKPSATTVQSHSQGATQFSQGNFDFNQFAQYVPTTNQVTPNVAYKPSQPGVQSSPNAAHFYSGLPTSSGAPNTASINSGHNLFAGLQSSPNYASLFAGAAGQDAAKYNVNPQTAASAYGGHTTQAASSYPQFANSATPSANYKPVVETSAPDAGAKLQYQSPNVNTIFGAGNANFDISKFQSFGANLPSSIPSGHNFNLNQISNVQATDNKYGQYAIDIRQGTNPNGAAQVMVQTNYNLGAQNVQNAHSSAPVSAASDNRNVRYVYVPSYTPSSPGPDTAHQGK